MTDVASERRAFEAVERRNANLPDDYKFPRPGALRYEQRTREDRWQGWLARSAIPTVVSEEMVEAACRAWQGHLVSPGAWENEHPRMQVAARETMRLCLTAALTVSSEPKDGR